MKKNRPLLWMAVVALGVVAACENLEEPRTGMVSVRVEVGVDASLRTKASGPDVSTFIFHVEDGDGNPVRSGTVAELNEGLQLAAGAYRIEVYSHLFEAPEFDRPCYAGETSFSVVAGESCVVSLVCTQSNAGVRVLFTDNFAGVYQTEDYYLSIKAVGGGSLVFDAGTTARWGYFAPGPLLMCLYVNGVQKSSLLRTVSARTKLQVEISPETIVVVPVTTDITVEEGGTDITQSWKVNRDEGNTGATAAKALTVGELQQYAGLLEGSVVWVQGYIVSGKISAGKVTFGAAGAGSSHLALAGSADETVSAGCISVELPSSPASIREALAVDGHPELIGRFVWIKGKVSSNYLGLAGIKGSSEFKFEL